MMVTALKARRLQSLMIWLTRELNITQGVTTMMTSYNDTIKIKPLAMLGLAAMLLMYAVVSLAQPTVTFEQRRILVMSGGDFIDANGNDLLNTGESIEYDHTVLNVANVDLQNIQLTDITGTVTCPQTTLAAGAAMTCMSTHVITAAEATAGAVNSSINVSAETATGQPSAAANTVNRQNNQSRSSIKMVKAPFTAEDNDQSGFNSIGDLIEYRFVVKNSNTNDLDLITIIEPDPSRIDTPIVCAGQTVGGQIFSGNQTGMLPSQDVIVCTAEYTIRQLDLDNGSVDNAARVEALPPIGSVISGTAVSVASVAEFTPDLLPEPQEVPVFSGRNIFIMLALFFLIGLYSVRTRETG